MNIKEAAAWRNKMTEKEKRLKESIEGALVEMKKTSNYLVSVANFLTPKQHLVNCPAGIHAFNLDSAGSFLEEALADTEDTDWKKCPECGGDGEISYANTAGPRGGCGGQMMSSFSCPHCKGTGRLSLKEPEDQEDED